ncbi:MAG: right-handed parallel beta-helix repeat-containing protein [Candidatus Eiseniibacteriota bacterium]|jgi:hypothetical protein
MKALRAVCMLPLLATSAALASTFVVRPDGTGDYPTIQAAIDAATSGDTVLAVAGTYSGPGNRAIDPDGKEVVVRSEDGPDLTIIDCEHAGRALQFDDGEGPGAVVEGFTIRNGWYAPGGGAIRCAWPSTQPTIRDCIFLNNVGGDGGAIAIVDHGAPSIEDCTFLENEGTEGGAIYIAGQAATTIARCTFVDNWASGLDTGFGGAIRCLGGLPVVTECTFVGNRGLHGGAIAMFASTATFESCTFVANESSYGGALHIQQTEPWTTLTLGHSIIAFNDGVAVHAPPFQAYLDVACNDIHGNWCDWCGILADLLGVNGNISEDPRFCDLPGGDLTIDASSPCAPANSGGCSLIGALSVGCGPIAVESTTWGTIKAHYR